MGADGDSHRNRHFKPRSGLDLVLEDEPGLGCRGELCERPEVVECLGSGDVVSELIPDEQVLVFSRIDVLYPSGLRGELVQHESVDDSFLRNDGDFESIFKLGLSGFELGDELNRWNDFVQHYKQQQ